jgi:hypothetical protein
MADQMGLPESTLRGWQSRHWITGQHYIIVGKTTLIDPVEVQKWLQTKAVHQKASTSTTAVIASDLSTKVSYIGKFTRAI